MGLKLSKTSFWRKYCSNGWSILCLVNVLETHFGAKKSNGCCQLSLSQKKLIFDPVGPVHQHQVDSLVSPDSQKIISTLWYQWVDETYQSCVVKRVYICYPYLIYFHRNEKRFQETIGDNHMLSLIFDVKFFVVLGREGLVNYSL